MEFTVLMSLYAKENPTFLNECLESIYKQSLPVNYLVLVFDGPLNSDLYSVVESWSERLPIIISKIPQNVGLAKALNVGLNLCTTDLILRMDTDDICRVDRFEKQVRFLIDNPDIDICSSWVDEIHPESQITTSIRKVPEFNYEIRREIVRRNPFNHMAVGFRKSAIERVGGYQHLSLMEDWFLWMRLLASGSKAYNIQESLVFARTGNGMLMRRTGLHYVHSEWLISKIKVRLGLASRWSALIIFIVRSLPRLLPKRIVRCLYALARKI